LAAADLEPVRLELVTTRAARAHFLARGDKRVDAFV
jgi:hypothetical protein